MDTSQEKKKTNKVNSQQGSITLRNSHENISQSQLLICKTVNIMHFQSTVQLSPRSIKQPRQFKFKQLIFKATKALFQSSTGLQADNMLQILNNLNLWGLMERQDTAQLKTQAGIPQSLLIRNKVFLFTVTPSCWNQWFRALIKLLNYMCIQISGLQTGDLLRLAPTDVQLDLVLSIPSLHTPGHRHRTGCTFTSSTSISILQVRFSFERILIQQFIYTTLGGHRAHWAFMDTRCKGDITAQFRRGTRGQHSLKCIFFFLPNLPESLRLVVHGPSKPSSGWVTQLR